MKFLGFLWAEHTTFTQIQFCTPGPKATQKSSLSKALQKTEREEYRCALAYIDMGESIRKGWLASPLQGVAGDSGVTLH